MTEEKDDSKCPACKASPMELISKEAGTNSSGQRRVKYVCAVCGETIVSA